MNFAELNLHPNLFKAIEACGYTKATPIQTQAIPSILAGKDLIAAAQTGTGKTAAFMLPTIQYLTQSKAAGKARVLILTPTRELATQVSTAAATYGKFLRLNVVNIVGGMPYPKQIQALAKPVDIIVATPGRLMDHMKSRRIDLSKIEMLILDEADRMLDMGFIDAVEQIAKATPKNRQTLLFSATVDSKLARLAKNILNQPAQINIDTKVSAPTKIKQHLHVADNPQHKQDLLQYLLVNETIFKAIIFCGTKIAADNLAKLLRQLGYTAGALHGDLRQNQRNKTVQDLRQGRIQILVATDVAARGIDINNISHVINYDLPKFAEDYVHRIGRTGRAGESGLAISLVMANDLQHLQRIERYLNQRIPQLVIVGLEPKKSLHSDNAPKKAHKKRSQARSRNSSNNVKSGARFNSRKSSSASQPSSRTDGRKSYATPKASQRADSRKPHSVAKPSQRTDSRKSHSAATPSQRADSRKSYSAAKPSPRTEQRKSHVATTAAQPRKKRYGANKTRKKI